MFKLFSNLLRINTYGGCKSASLESACSVRSRVLTLALEHCSRVLNRQNLITITSQSVEPDYQMSLMMLTNLEQAQREQRERTSSVDSNIRNSPNNAVSCSRLSPARHSAPETKTFIIIRTLHGELLF